MGRTATGVRGISLDNDVDEVIGMVCVDDAESTILVVSEKGYGKRSDLDEYRITNRGGKGVKTLNITEKTGSLVGIMDVTDKDDLMIINKTGVTIRLSVDELRVMGRATQGVRLIKLKESDTIASIAKVGREEEDENAATEDGIENDGTDIDINNSADETGGEATPETEA